MNEEILQRVMQVFFYTGGIVAFWQITKHMPKAFHNLLEYIFLLTISALCITPISALIEYVLGGNIDTTMMFVAGFCTVSLLSLMWIVMVQSSRALQGKKQYKYVVL
jgi:uncharacterized membrane protein YfhO